MKKRPKLKPGDVCKQSNIGRRGRKQRINRRLTLVVVSLSGDSQEGSTRVRCICHDSKYKRVYKGTFRRRELWFTGRNINDGPREKRQKLAPIAQAINNDGRETCISCGAPTKAFQGLMSIYRLCVNPACEWNGK